LLPAGQLIWVAIAQPLQLHQGKLLPHLLAALGLRKMLQTKGNILSHSQVRKKGIVLEY